MYGLWRVRGNMSATGDFDQGRPVCDKRGFMQGLRHVRQRMPAWRDYKGVRDGKMDGVGSIDCLFAWR